MKLQADRIEGQNAIARHGPDGVIVNGIEHRSSVVVPWHGAVLPWPVHDFASLTAAHFDALAALAPELVVFGSGSRIRFPSPLWTRALIERRIGVETMDTAAACRTYNVLLPKAAAWWPCCCSSGLRRHCPAPGATRLQMTEALWGAAARPGAALIISGYALRGATEQNTS